MRVTPGMTAANALYNLQQGRAKNEKIQEQVASGLNINRPSDDPLSARQVLNLEGKLKESQQYGSNITKGQLWLSMTDTALTGVSDVVDQVKSIASSMVTDVTDTTINSVNVAQLKELKKQLVDLANTKLGDQYIFAGFQNNAVPFDDNGNATGSTAGAINVDIDRDSPAQINVSGEKLFLGTGGAGDYGPINIFDEIDNLIGATTVAQVQTGIQKMKDATNQVVSAQADVAGRQIRFEAAQTMATRNQNTLKNMISDIQNVDYAKAGVELSQQQTAFQAALSTTAKITNLSLLDYLN